MMQGQLTDAKSVLSFILAGNSTTTFRSAKTGTHYTYRVRLGEKRNPTDPDTFFVKLLTGPDNESAYTYIGMIRNGVFTTTRATKLPKDSVPIKTFTWVFAHLQKNVIPVALEVWHEGRCGRCGRKLTVPESIASGFGPECAQYVVELPLVNTNATPVIDQPRVKPTKQPKQNVIPFEEAQYITNGYPAEKTMRNVDEEEDWLDNVPEL
jgi:hypothetical protein